MKVTLAVYYYRDSPERERNLQNFLEYYKSNQLFDIQVLHSVKPIPLMQAYNQIASQSTTEYIVFTDVDCLIETMAYENALDLISSGEADFVNPFDRIYDVKNPSISGAERVEFSSFDVQEKQRLHDDLLVYFQFKRTFSSLGEADRANLNWAHKSTWNTPFFVGLSVVTRLSTFCEFGMGNEYFKVWGMADDEWYARALTLDLVWKNIEGIAYHQNHPRSYLKHPLGKNNLFELVKSISFSSDELRAYIETWPWYLDYKNKLL